MHRSRRNNGTEYNRYCDRSPPHHTPSHPPPPHPPRSLNLPDQSVMERIHRSFDRRSNDIRHIRLSHLPQWHTDRHLSHHVILEHRTYFCHHLLLRRRGRWRSNPCKYLSTIFPSRFRHHPISRYS